MDRTDSQAPQDPGISHPAEELAAHCRDRTAVFEAMGNVDKLAQYRSARIMAEQYLAEALRNAMPHAD